MLSVEIVDALKASEPIKKTVKIPVLLDRALKIKATVEGISQTEMMEQILTKAVDPKYFEMVLTPKENSEK